MDIQHRRSRIFWSFREKTVIYVGLSTLEYLKKGGRINTTTALAANLLNIKPVMKFGTGKLDVFPEMQRHEKSRKAMIDAMHRELETTFKKNMMPEKYILWLPPAALRKLPQTGSHRSGKAFPGMDVMCDDLSLDFPAILARTDWESVVPACPL